PDAAHAGGSRAAPEGRAVVANAGRWAACSAVIATGFIVATAVALAFVHSRRPIGSLAWLFVPFGAVESVVAWALLRSEESRLTRELRTARIGSAALRAMTVQRREAMPFFARPFATGVGAAAVRLADGDREGAAEALRRVSPLMRGGRVDALRALALADLERSQRTTAALDRVIARLQATPALGHREADRYRTYVLVKTVLERGDDETALELARDLARSPDDEQAIYGVWLRVWFDLDDDPGAADEPWPPLGEAQARLATLAARAHGAERLIGKLEALLLAIANAEHRE
ncbi:MAG: hypothetical protein FWD17_07880, partial [Polyangiaceae bacterium]|nr:hypothetical protein [Polyangiaceae bacterium]